MTNENHAKDQAAAQYESIVAMMSALNCDFDRLEELQDERDNLDHETDVVNTASAYGLEQERRAFAALVAWEEDNAEEFNDLKRDAGDYKNQDEVREALNNDPLSIEYRSGWTSYGDAANPEEFRILLCTGGPAVQIRGELDVHGAPYRAWLEYQDWGTPWTRYFEADQDTLLAYCQEFIFE
jgi:hypothetical protein